MILGLIIVISLSYILVVIKKTKNKKQILNNQIANHSFKQIQDNKIGDEGMKVLSGWLKNNHSLQILGLGGIEYWIEWLE